MISPGKRWFLYRSLVAGGVMSGCLSWSSSGQGGVITRAIMSWVRKQVQQVDKTSLRWLGSRLETLSAAQRYATLYTTAGYRDTTLSKANAFIKSVTFVLAAIS